MTNENREDAPVEASEVDAPIASDSDALPPPRRRRRRSVLRSLIRQLAAAVYVVLAHSFVAGLFVSMPLFGIAVEVAFVFAASALLARMVEGSLASVGFVGAWVGLFSLVIALTALDWSDLDARFWILRAAHVVWLTAAGLAGAHLGQRGRTRRS